MTQQPNVINFTGVRMQRRRKERWRAIRRFLHGVYVIPFATTIGLVIALAMSSWWNFDLELSGEVGWFLVAVAGLLVAGTIALLKVTAEWWDDLVPCFNRRGELTTTADTCVVATVVAMMTLVALMLIDLWGPDWLANAVKGVALILLLVAAVLTGVSALARFIGPDIVAAVDCYKDTHDLREVWQVLAYGEDEEYIEED